MLIEDEILLNYTLKIVYIDKQHNTHLGNICIELTINYYIQLPSRIIIYDIYKIECY